VQNASEMSSELHVQINLLKILHDGKAKGQRCRQRCQSR